MFYFYKYKDKVLFSQKKYNDLHPIDKFQPKKYQGILYYLVDSDPKSNRRSFIISDPSLLFIENEDWSLLKQDNKKYNIPQWLEDKIYSLNVISLNTNYPSWQDMLNPINNKKWRINLVGLGDVGTTLLIGLRLLGGEDILSLGIYGRSPNKVDRLHHELNQIYAPFYNNPYPDIVSIDKDNLFECDMFIFCASAGVPSLDSNVKDVRMFQFQKNSEIISIYAKLARDKGFKGIFAVVSDPVDLLCKVAFLESNKNSNNVLDFNGLAPEQIRGYGLGVMNARARYYAMQSPKTMDYLHDGRAFGPHGEDLIIANSISNYDDKLSLMLTERTIKANLAVRDTGFKPYIAPALSSGSLSILATIREQWHYSATFMGGVFMGSKNRLPYSKGIELERLSLPEDLENRIKNTYERLESII